MSIEECENCKYSKIMSEYKAVVQCRFNPPTVINFDRTFEGYVSVYPEVLVTEWCGQYKENNGAIK